MVNRERDRPVGVVVLRACVGLMALVLIPPFVVLVVAPLLLMLLPVAFVALPFMLCAFAGESCDVPSVTRLRSSFPPHSGARTVYPYLVRSQRTRAPSVEAVPARSGPAPIEASPADGVPVAKDR